jgi:hypothetical protein
MSVVHKTVYVFTIVGIPDIEEWIFHLSRHVSDDSFNTPFGVVIDWRRAERPWTPEEAERGLKEIAPMLRGRITRQAWVAERPEWFDAFQWASTLLIDAHRSYESRFKIFDGDLGAAVEWAGDYL